MMETAAVQVPCFALLIVLCWKLGSLAINKWSANQAEQIKVLAKGDEERTRAIAKGFADITAELKSHGERLVRIEDRLDARNTIAEAVDEATGPASKQINNAA